MLKDDLPLLEESIRRLQIEWEKFFSGVEKKPPNDMKTRVERLIRHYAFTEIRNNAERFRYQTLTARYNTFNEMWMKRLRALEEGRPMPGMRVAPPAPSAPPPAAAAAAAARPAADEPLRVTGAGSDSGAVRSLFDQFMAARKASGDEAAVKFESFEKLISTQASRILSQQGGHAVDFRLETKGGKVSLKAKPVK